MDLIAILDRKACTLNLPERDPEAFIGKIADIASCTAALDGIPSEVIYEKLMQREREGSTGIGNGIAIPHARVEGITRFILFIVTSKRGIDFGALDRKKVHTFFILIGPEGEINEHLKILAAISHVLSLSDVKKELRSAITTTGLYEAFLRNVRIAENKQDANRKYKALFVILYIDEFLYDILQFFIQAGIEGATVIDSSGMGKYISNIPLFASFIGFMNEEKNRSSTIVAMVPDNQLQEIVEGIEHITGDLDKKEGAMLFAVDVPFMKGTMKMM